MRLPRLLTKHASPLSLRRTKPVRVCPSKSSAMTLLSTAPRAVIPRECAISAPTRCHSEERRHALTWESLFLLLSDYILSLKIKGAGVF